MNFKTWKEAKKVKEHDLLFMGSLKSDQQLDLFKKISDQMSLFEPSFTEGMAFLELSTDLILMGHLETLFENSEAFENWKKHLHGLRYPITTASDEKNKDSFLKLPWPTGSKVKFERRGDRSGVEVKLFISNPTDLTKVLASLERVKQEMS